MSDNIKFKDGIKAVVDAYQCFLDCGMSKKKSLDATISLFDSMKIISDIKKQHIEHDKEKN